MSVFHRDGIDFFYEDSGHGVPFVFQHGLGGDTRQPLGLFGPPPGCRLLSMDCRGHGQTATIGDLDKVGLIPFADDVVGLLDYLGIERAIIGGISMGTAISLELVLRRPERVLGLVLSRPAWLEGPQPRNVTVYNVIIDLIATQGARHGQQLFRETPEFAEVARESPETAWSLLRIFEISEIERRLPVFEQIAHDQPKHTLADLKAIRVPTLVLANRRDLVHPFELGQTLAAAIPGAEFAEMTARAFDKEQHAADLQAAIDDFLRRHFAIGAS
jgi:pimeloyl-ACP methyl ester carboxylesterase